MGNFNTIYNKINESKDFRKLMLNYAHNAQDFLDKKSLEEDAQNESLEIEVWKKEIPKFREKLLKIDFDRFIRKYYKIWLNIDRYMLYLSHNYASVNKAIDKIVLKKYLIASNVADLLDLSEEFVKTFFEIYVNENILKPVGSKENGKYEIKDIAFLRIYLLKMWFFMFDLEVDKFSKKFHCLSASSQLRLTDYLESHYKLKDNNVDEFIKEVYNFDCNKDSKRLDSSTYKVIYKENDKVTTLEFQEMEEAMAKALSLLEELPRVIIEDNNGNTLYMGEMND